MIDTVIVKAIRACNLRCDYCYYINDETRDYGISISDETVARLYERLSAHSRDRPVEMVWHGGEPLLLGKVRFQKFLSMQREHFEPGRVLNKIQTNGSLVSDDWIEIFREHDIAVGVSLDGLRESHDRHRRKINGRRSFFDALRAIRLLRNARLQVGVLAVVTGDGCGAATMRFLNRLGVSSVEFLLPISNHALLKAGKTASIDFAKIGKFLCDAYRQWLGIEGRRVPVDFFEALILNAFGRDNDYAYTGPSREALTKYVIVETDGAICMDEEYGQLDRFGIASEYGIGCNVYDADFSFDEVESRLRDAVTMKRLGDLPDECASCGLRAMCRGSHPGTRYSDIGHTFNRRSVYCAQMIDLCASVLQSIRQAGMLDRVKDGQLRAYAEEREARDEQSVQMMQT